MEMQALSGARITQLYVEEWTIGGLEAVGLDRQDLDKDS